ncbi:hypothetical protein IEQ_05012 [Bacillus cereus BAG6X1-2]|nr:hypothetical protein IEQ_05012 [Bacillus cereus BAG6X1-2]
MMNKHEIYVRQMNAWIKEQEVLRKQIRMNIETSSEIARQNGIQLQLLNERSNQSKKEFEELKKEYGHILDMTPEQEEKKEDIKKAIKVLRTIATELNKAFNGILEVIGQGFVNEERANKRYVTKEYLTADAIQQGSLKSGNARYKCGCCGYADKVEVMKDEHFDGKICPKCKGAFVDCFVYRLYK